MNNDMRIWSVITIVFSIGMMFAGIYVGKHTAGVTNIGQCQPVVLQAATIGTYKLVPSEGHSFYSCVDPK